MGLYGPPPDMTMTVEEIGLAVRRHHVVYPKHGYNCACLDKYVQAARRMLMRDWFAELAGKEFTMAGALSWNALDSVLKRAMQK